MKKKNEAKNQKLEKWKSRLEKARTAYAEELNRMDIRDNYYNGAREVYKDRNGTLAAKKANTVWNIIYELIESQVDTTIPLPRVEAMHEEDEPLAKNIEDMLRNIIQEQHFTVMNDLQERTVPIQGGTYWQVEWDPKGGSHCVLGDVVVSDRHPKQVIPQPGVTNILDMDYVFLCLSQSKEFIKRRYGVEVEEDTEEHPEVRANSENAQTVEGLCTQNLVYYRNENGSVGLYSWVNDQELVDIEDYQARRLERCTKCGSVKLGDTCECGNKTFKEVNEEYEEITEPIQLFSGERIGEERVIGDEIQTDLEGNPLVDSLGETITMPVTEKTRIPYYKPDSLPVILRRNVSKFGSLLGGSDVDVVADQQETIKECGTKLKEKILTGGSFVTLPYGLSVDTSSKEFKVVRVKTPAEKALIGVMNVQPDISKEQTAVAQSYEQAKSTLGITDAFQGKYDSSATSGTAKQFSANQAAGRLQSKREMKNQAYSQLYRMIFQFMLAYSDQKVPVNYTASDGSRRYTHFNRYDFLRKDAAGEFYWDDEFIFTIDSSATLSSNRDILWNQLDLKFQNGAFGVLGADETMLRYWTQLAHTNYPYAEQMKQSIQDSMKRKEEAQNAMQLMQNGTSDSAIPDGSESGYVGSDPGAGDGLPQP